MIKSFSKYCHSNYTSNYRNYPIKSFIRSLFIQPLSTPNENAIKFAPSGTKILPDNITNNGSQSATIEYLSGREAIGCPLAHKLFSLPGISSVMLGSNFITVEKSSSIPWQEVKPEIFSIITEYISSTPNGKGPININIEKNSDGTPINMASDTAPHPDDSEVISMIKELIDTRIRPAIQEDGGDLEFRGFNESTGIVKLKLRGACRSCDSSSVTLQHGIESMLMHYVEEVKGVEQVLDPEEQIGLDEFNKLEKNLKQHTE